MSQHHFKFSNAEDPNDPGMLSKALGKMKLRQPETYGGKLLDTTTPGREYDEFNLHTPPDVTNNTRVVAICGIKQAEADPTDDGWFLSDFFAFHHLLTGLTKNQVWLHCLDLKQLVAKYRPYLHGSPFRTRKVVMDNDIIDRANDLVQVSTPGGLKLRFEQTLRKQCQEASKAGNESVLVLMFGHGDKYNGGIHLGTQSFKQQQFAKTFAGLDVPVTILSTACYSGGWSCNKTFDKKDPNHQFNSTTMMAAGEVAHSYSWNYTTTLGKRACGSVFASAFVESMTRVNNEIKLIDEESDHELTPEQEKTYAEFCETLHKTLLMDYDRLGFEHDITFSAQDDAWNMCWRERTGIPLEKFKDRWEQLQDHVPDPYLHQGDPFNKDPHITPEQEAEYIKLKKEDAGRNMYEAKRGTTNATGGSVLGKRKTSGMYGGTVQGLINQVCYLGGQYLESYPGRTITGDDGALWNRINRIQLGEETNQDVIEYCLRCIQYRMEQMTAADRYLKMMAVPAPLNQECHEFDTKYIETKVGRDFYHEMTRLIFDRQVLFPLPLGNTPSSNQGRPFYKGHDYLVAAFYHAKMTKEAVVKKLDELVVSINQVFKEEEAMYKEEPELKSKRQKLFHAFGINLGSTSPWKRRSRGQSLGDHA
ncbi:MAG: hypothetical protein Q9198_002230 [Flavoplaca austrocitrina]